MAYFEIEKAEGKATLHHLLRDTYKAIGDLQQARQQYAESRQLQAEAKEMETKLPPLTIHLHYANQ